MGENIRGGYKYVMRRNVVNFVYIPSSVVRGVNSGLTIVS
jgi:hypothetical protein